MGGANLILRNPRGHVKSLNLSLHYLGSGVWTGLTFQAEYTFYILFQISDLLKIILNEVLSMPFYPKTLPKKFPNKYVFSLPVGVKTWNVLKWKLRNVTYYFLMSFVKSSLPTISTSGSLYVAWVLMESVCVSTMVYKVLLILTTFRHSLHYHWYGQHLFIKIKHAK